MLPPGPLYLGFLDARLDDCHHLFGYVVLQFEYVDEIAVEAFGPKVCTGGGIQKLGIDPQSIAGLPHPSFQYVSGQRPS